MSEGFLEQGEPPAREYRGFVRRVKPGNDLPCTIVSATFWRAWVHWQGRSIPCFKAKKSCPGCKLRWPRKFLGYLFIYNEHNRKYEHLELPLDACHDLADAVGPDGQLRGTRVKIKRIGGTKGRLFFDLQSRIEAVAPGFALAEDQDPSSILEYLWGVNVGKLKLADDTDLPARDAM